MMREQLCMSSSFDYAAKLTGILDEQQVVAPKKEDNMEAVCVAFLIITETH